MASGLIAENPGSLDWELAPDWGVGYSWPEQRNRGLLTESPFPGRHRGGEMKLAGLRILVTGGLGYIGSETARQLTDVGADVHVIDDCSEGHIEAWDGPWTRIDLRDRDRFLTFAAGREWDAVFHFAARCYVGESMCGTP